MTPHIHSNIKKQKKSYSFDDDLHHDDDLHDHDDLDMNDIIHNKMNSTRTPTTTTPTKMSSFTSPFTSTSTGTNSTNNDFVNRFKQRMSYVWISYYNHNDTTTALPPPSHPNNSSSNTDNANTKKYQRLWFMLLICGLLFVEYHVQDYYYRHHNNTNGNRNGNNPNAVNVNSIVNNNNIPKSTDFLQSLELEQCHFPIYSDPSRTRYQLEDNLLVTQPAYWRQRNERLRGIEDAENVYRNIVRSERERYHEVHVWKKHHPNGPRFPITRRVQRNITFVHIGKAGGSTIACNLRNARKFISDHCDNINYSNLDDDTIDPASDSYIPESAISRSINCYTHWRMHLKCMYLQGTDPFDGLFNKSHLGHPDNLGSRQRRRLLRLGSSTDNNNNNNHQQQQNEQEEFEYDYDKDDEMEEQRRQLKQKEKRNYDGNDYLLNVRSPVDRIASWFVYEHAENHQSIYPDRDYHCGQLILSSCYKHFEHLTTIGLSGPRPPINQPLRVGLNLTATECSHWAWAAVQGNVAADYHNAYNYDWYAHSILHDEVNAEADVFVLRVEHLEYDWSTVDKMLGGDGRFPETMESKQNSAAIKPLVITNHDTTDIGIRNLCRALCDEIQVYKQLLLRAVNLGPEDLEISMEDLRKQCPEEVDIYPRKCVYD